MPRAPSTATQMPDSTSSNVVAMASPPRARAEKRRRKAGQLLLECRDMAALRLSRALPAVMDKLDDALFELADKSESNTVQSFYFEAMRDLRIRRPGIEAKFNEQLMREADPQIARSRRTRPSPKPADVPSMSLGLVDNDELEESLAVANMVAKIKSACGTELFTLDRRIGWLLEDPELDTLENPIGPECICRAFREACSEVEEIEVKLIVLKLFDKHVVNEIGPIYRDINHHLIGNDILPNIRPEVRKRPGGRAAGSRGPAPIAGQWSTPGGEAATRSEPGRGHGHMMPAFPSAAGALEPGHFHWGSGAAHGASQQELLATLQEIMSVNGSLAEGEPDANLLSGLTALQLGNTGAVPGAEAALDGSSLAAGNSNVLRCLKRVVMTGESSRVDSLMVDVVAMMFDYILDDADIPAAMKALIGRLQIPLLKVAILDKAFFSRRFHPARKLLNTLAEAAVGWSEEEEGAGALHREVEAIVQRILGEFEDDVGLFSEVLADFEEFLAEEERRAEENAWWSTEVIQSRERLAGAKTRVNGLIEARLGSIEHPFVEEFLRVHWYERLMTAYVKDGEDSAIWQEAIETMDDLIWSIAPKPIAEDRKRLTTLLPGLLKRLKDGMARSMPDDEREAFLAQLAGVHLATVRPGAEPCAQPQPEAEPAPAPLEDAEAPEVGSVSAGSESESTAHMRAALDRANVAIYRVAQDKPHCQGMGTTVVAAKFHDGLVTIGHAGDSRAYRLRDERLEGLTIDHSLREELVRKGFYTAEEAEEAVGSNIVTRALGIEEVMEVDAQELSFRPGDLFLFCSDGLSDVVDDALIESILVAPADLETTATALVTSANDRGGPDNISVILARVRDEPLDVLDAEGERGRLEIAARTDVGRRRSHNEDCIGSDAEASAVVLADGMGGCNAGEVASAIAVEQILAALRERAPSISVRPTGDTSGINFAAINALFDEPESEDTAPETDAARAWLEEDGAAAEIEEIELEGTLESTSGDSHVATVNSLEVGSWVAFKNSDGSTTRARLTWISSATGKYLFTNRRGQKVLDATPLGLAVEFREGNASLVDSVPLFERAVSNLLAHLRSPE